MVARNWRKLDGGGRSIIAEIDRKRRVAEQDMAEPLVRQRHATLGRTRSMLLSQAFGEFARQRLGQRVSRLALVVAGIIQKVVEVHDRRLVGVVIRLPGCFRSFCPRHVLPGADLGRDTGVRPRCGW